MIDVKSDDGHYQRFDSNSASHAHSKIYHLYDRFCVSNILVLGNFKVWNLEVEIKNEEQK